MTTFVEMLRNITPEVYASLKQAVEIGKWPDGRRLTQEQKELCMQAMIGWELENLPEEERTGFMEQRCKSEQKSSEPVSNEAVRYYTKPDTLH